MQDLTLSGSSDPIAVPPISPIIDDDSYYVFVVAKVVRCLFFFALFVIVMLLLDGCLCVRLFSHRLSVARRIVLA